MKSKKIVAAFLVLVCIFCLFPFGCFSLRAADTQTNDRTERHTQKIVSVVYDNSGSMENNDKRQHYAHYALQMLTALLNSQDQLYITPMNESLRVPVSTLDLVRRNIKEVNLKLPDRSEQIRALLLDAQSKWHVPAGSTPLESVSSTIEYLETDKGLGKNTGEDQEYWLVVFTDGSFDPSTSSIEEELKKPLQKYNNFHVIYLTLGSKVTTITDTNIKGSPNFTAYHSEDAASLIASMQKIANQLTGRCNTTQYAIDSSGKKLTIDVGNVGFSLKQLSVLLQNSNAVLKSAKIDGKDLSVSQPVVIQPNGKLNMKNGYSAVLSMENGSTITSGKLTLEFTEAIGEKDIVIMLEPSLLLKPVVEYEDKNGNVQILSNHQDISTLAAGTNVRIYYSIVDAETGKEVSEKLVFGNTQVKKTLTYDGKNIATCAYEDKTSVSVSPFKVSVGDHTVMLNVTNESAANVADGGYTLYTTFTYSIADRPDYFRVESESKRISQSTYQYELSFTVFSENLPLTKAQLANYDWNCYTDKGIQFTPSVTEENGIAVIRGIVSPTEFGEYKITMRVTDKQNRSRVAETTETIVSYPGKLSVDVHGPSEAGMTENEFRNSKESFSFALEMDGNQENFSSSYITYTVMLDGTKDITEACKVENGKLVLALSYDNLGKYILTPGTSEITVSAKIPAAALEDSVSVRFVLEPSSYSVIPFPKNGEEIDRFRLHENMTAAYFEVQRDNISLSEEELRAFMEAGIIRIDSDLAKDKFSVAKINLTTEIVNGKAMVCARPSNNHFRVLYDWITSMFIVGTEKDFTATVYEAQAMTTIPLKTPNPWSYVWRIGLFFVIAYFVWLIYSWIFQTKYLPSGIFCAAEVKIDPIMDTSTAVSLNSTKINVSPFEKFMFRRLFPGSVKQSRTVTGAGNSLTLLPNGRAGVSVTLLESDFPNAKVWRMNKTSPLSQKSTEISNTFFASFCDKEMISGLDFSHTESEILFDSEKHSANLVVADLTNPICLKSPKNENGSYHLIFFVKAP